MLMHDWRTVLSRKCLVFFPLTKGEVLPVLCFLEVASWPLPFFGSVLFLLGSVCAINVRVRTFVFCFFSVSFSFWWGFAYIFAYFLKSSPRKCFKTILFMSGLVSLGSFSLLRLWVDYVFVVSFLSLSL